MLTMCIKPGQSISVGGQVYVCVATSQDGAVLDAVGQRVLCPRGVFTQLMAGVFVKVKRSRASRATLVFQAPGSLVVERE